MSRLIMHVFSRVRHQACYLEGARRADIRMRLLHMVFPRNGALLNNGPSSMAEHRGPSATTGPPQPWHPSYPRLGAANFR